MKRIFFEGRLKFIFIPVAAAAFLSLISFVVMQLWNNLIPAIFHLGVITFWQAMGIFVLCKILFGFGKGGRGFGRDGSRWKRERMAEHFKNMTPEQREQFKQKMNDRMCGHRGRFGRHGFDYDWANFTEEQAAKDEPKSTE